MRRQAAAARLRAVGKRLQAALAAPLVAAAQKESLRRGCAATEHTNVRYMRTILHTTV